MKIAALLTMFVLAVHPFASGQPQADQKQAQIEDLQKRLNEMRAEIERIAPLRSQMTEIQTEIDALQGKGEQGAKQLSQAAQQLATPAQQNGTIVNTQPPPPPSQISGKQTREGAGEATRTYDTFSEDPFAVARLYNVPLDPKYTGYFVLPGTETLMRIGGYAKTDALYDLRPTGNAEEFIPSTIPVPTIAATNNWVLSVRPTRLSLDFRIPKSKAGDVRMYFEGDLFGTNANTPRLRHVYAQVANLVVGQTFSNFMDADTWPDTLDYQGPNSIVNVRNPQIRYGFPIGGGASMYVSAEKPFSDISFTTSEGAATPATPLPDLSVRFRYEAERGHIQAAAMFRKIGEYQPTGQEESVFGWGVSVSGLLRTYKLDNLVFQAEYGRGIARYINDTSGLGLDAAPQSASDASLRALPVVAPYIGYQHYWSNSLRSTATFGYVLVQGTDFQPGTTFHKSTYSAANIIWNPMGSLNIGAEYLYGTHEIENGEHSYASRLQLSAKYSFVKVKKETK